MVSQKFHERNTFSCGTEFNSLENYIATYLKDSAIENDITFLLESIFFFYYHILFFGKLKIVQYNYRTLLCFFKDGTTPIRFWRHISDTIPLTPELAVDPSKMRNKRGVSCTKLSLQSTSFLVSMELFCSWFELLNSPCSTQYLLWLWNMKLNSQLSISVFLKYWPKLFGCKVTYIFIYELLVIVMMKLYIYII